MKNNEKGFFNFNKKKSSNPNNENQDNRDDSLIKNINNNLNINKNKKIDNVESKEEFDDMNEKNIHLLKNKMINESDDSKINEFSKKEANNAHELLLINRIKELEQERSNLILQLENERNKFKDFQIEISDWKSKISERLQENIEDIRKKMELDLEYSKKYLFEGKAKDLLEIYVQMSRVIKSDIKDQNVLAYIKGFEMFLNNFKMFLENNNIYEIKIKVGEIFDANYMECSDIIENHEKPNNTILKVINNAFKYHDRIIYTGKVIVSK